MDLQKGEHLYITSTTLAEDLIREIYREATKKGAHVSVDLSFREQGKIFMDEANDEQITYVSPIKKLAMEICDAYLYIRAPHNLKEEKNIDPEKLQKRNAAGKEINQIYFDRLADGSMKRSLKFLQHLTEFTASLPFLAILFSHFVSPFLLHRL